MINTTRLEPNTIRNGKAATGDNNIILVNYGLSTVKPCNCIYVLAHGQVVEQGTWDELFNAENSHLQRLASGAA